MVATDLRGQKRRLLEALVGKCWRWQWAWGEGVSLLFPGNVLSRSAKPVCKAFSVSQLNCIFGVYHMVYIKKFTSDLLTTGGFMVIFSF